MSRSVYFKEGEVVIEQLFTDIPNTAYNTTVAHHQSLERQKQAKDAGASNGQENHFLQENGPNKSIWNLSEKFLEGQTRNRQDSAVNGGIFTKNGAPSGIRRLSTQSTSTHSSSVHRVSSKSSKSFVSSKAQSSTKKTPKKNAGSDKSSAANPAGSKSMVEAAKTRRRSAGGTERMTAATAIAMFGNKLTAYERDEILGYSVIHYLGLKAKKINPASNVDGENAFDDVDHFYIPVQHDHIAYRYEITEKPVLGKGTFGQVVKAIDHKYGINVALKIVRNQRVYLKQSREELRILQVLKKQDPHGIYNIVTMHDFFMFRDHMIISFELLGMNLYQVIRKNGGRGLASTAILPIARAVLKCLELLSKNRIIHCDIKPENIMLRRNGELGSIKVGDFGSSCYEQQQIYHYIQSRYYRAPEVILGMRYGPAIDMWSLGCVLAELSTGYPVIMGSNEDDQLAAIEETCGEVPKDMLAKSKRKNQGTIKGRGPPGSNPITQLIPGSDNFKNLIVQMLEIDPTRRPTPTQLSDHPWISTNRASASSTISPIPTNQSKKSI